MNRKNFLEDRKKGIGGSDVAAIFGMSRFRTPYDVWKSKVSDTIEDEQSDVLQIASYLEEFTAQKYAMITNLRVRKSNIPVVNHQYDFLRGHIDRTIVLDHSRGIGILECKALSNFSFKKVEMYGLPDEYILQIQHYFLCGNGAYKWGAFAIINRDNGKLLTFDIDPDREIQQKIIDKCVPFWNEYVLKKVEPPSSSEPDTEMKIPKYEGTIEDMRSDEKLNQIVANYNQLQDMVTEANSLLDNAKTDLMSYLGDHQAVECNCARIYFKSSSRTSFDSKKFKEDQPELYKKYSKTTESARSLRIYKLENPT